jgi:uncharacterized membrane protein
MKENSELRALARNQLHGTWLAAAGMFFIYCICITGSSSLVGVGLLILGGPLTVGLCGYFLRKTRGETAKVENLFDGFKIFRSSFLLFLLQGIFIILWSCLFFVPGIVKSFSYSMAFFILRDNPDTGALEAINISRKMMNGYKGKLFCLYLSFIGWFILCSLTLGIGSFWLGPYIDLSVANFYEYIKQNQQQTVN